MAGRTQVGRVAEISRDILGKYETLKYNLAALGSVAVAFSGGVDSTFLLMAAREALGDKVLAITVSSCLVPGSEMDEAAQFCRKLGIRHIMFEAKPLEIKGFKENPPERCYICKKSIFGKLREIAGENGITEIAEGSNMDDTGDYRPGMKAVKELGVRSPLMEAGLTKNEIRILSHQLDLPTWNKPSFACLASRIPYGEEISEEKLSMVCLAEEFLKSLEFTQFRVRLHGDLARIEILPEEFEKFMETDMRNRISSEFKRIGFAYTALDITGYRTGSMNEVLKET